jgi:RNA polymerase primary sigma factor
MGTFSIPRLSAKRVTGGFEISSRALIFLVLNVTFAVPAARTPTWAKGCEKTLAREAPGDALGAYRREMGTFDLIDADREKLLSKQIWQGKKHLEKWIERVQAKTGIPPTREQIEKIKANSVVQVRARLARDELSTANLRLVHWIAKKYQHRGELEDLVGEGNVGLMEAVDRYQSKFGTRFSTYATWWIRRAIRHSLIQMGSTIRIPVYIVGLLTQLDQVRKLLAQETGSEPSSEDVFDGLTDVTEERKALMHQAQAVGRVGSLSADRNDGETDSFEPQWQGSDPAEEVVEAEDLSRARAAIEKHLNALEKRLLDLSFGLDGNTPLKIASIARETGLSRKKIKKLLTRTLEKLEHIIAQKDFEEDPLPELQRAG